MLIPCPLCGPRDLREFTIRGAAIAERPRPGSSFADWDEYLHLRDNPAGITEEFWYHRHGCAAWLVVQRCTLSHRISAVWLAGQPRPEGQPAAKGMINSAPANSPAHLAAERSADLPAADLSLTADTSPPAGEAAWRPAQAPIPAASGRDEAQS